MKLETSSPAPQQPTTDSGMANLCAMLMTKMTEITDDLKSEVCALRAEHYAQQPTLCRTKHSTGLKERERVSRAKDLGVSHVQSAPNVLVTMHNATLLLRDTRLSLKRIATTVTNPQQPVSHNACLTPNACLHASLQSESIPQSVSHIMPEDKNTVAVSIYGYSVNALVDTGASISCTSSDLIPKLGIKPYQLKSSNVRDAVGVGGERHASLGAVSLPVSFDGPISPSSHLGS